jgi:hypothetical protein
MTIKASGRSALILAGLFVCFAAPSQAAAGADNATATAKSENVAGTQKYSSRHSKSYAQRKSGKQELKSPLANKAAAPEVAADDADNSPAIPTSVANANAQFAPAGTPAGDARAMSARANDILQPIDAQPAADSQVVAADQLNDLDRALHEGQPPAATMALASAEAPPVAAAPPVMASSQESSTWDQTSLIGKIFIGFGALLTMASAARMFMA